MPEQISLRNNYIQVIRKHSGEITYGGDQNFFRKTESAPKADKTAEKKTRWGCGVVALTDTLLYLDACKGNAPIVQDNYEAFYNTVYKRVGGICRGLGTTGISLARGFNHFSRRKGWKLRGRWGFSASKIYFRIEEMLQKDIPVILCIPAMLRKKDREKGITLYRQTENGWQKEVTINAHFVTVTGILMEEDETFFEISSWGKKYLIKWKEYEALIQNHFLGTILGNALWIK